MCAWLIHFHCSLVKLDSSLQKKEEDIRNQVRLRGGKRREEFPLI